MHSANGSPQTSDTSEMPETSETSEMPETPGTSETSESSEMVETSETKAVDQMYMHTTHQPFPWSEHYGNFRFAQFIKQDGLPT